jgi:hypothetical protein
LSEVVSYFVSKIIIEEFFAVGLKDSVGYKGIVVDR